MLVHEFVAKKTPAYAETTIRQPAYASLRGRDFLSVDDLSIQEIRSLFDLAADMKQRPNRYSNSLDGKILALIFEKPSLRTRTTFTVAIKQLGGDVVDFPPGDIGLAIRESTHDVAKNLERMVDGVMIRTFGHDKVTSFANFASIPVINGLTDFEHPCQAMADFYTLKEHKGSLDNFKLAYVGDGNNVAHSLLLMAAQWGIPFSIATPPDFVPDPDVLKRAKELARKRGGEIVLTTDPVEAVKDADAVYTDTWTSMGQETESEIRRQIFKPYQVNRALFSHAKPDALFMHCLPAHRGEEVTDEIIDSPNSVVFDQAENRLHVQKAILCALMSE